MGVNYGRVANDLPSPRGVVQLIKQHGIQKVKLYDTDFVTLAAFAGSGVELIVALPNEELRDVASSPSAARRWVTVNIARHLPGTRITAIAVGNEVLSSSNKRLASLLLPAMQNIHATLVELRLDGQIKVSSPHSLAILSVSYPPSAGTFASPVATSVMPPLLEFLGKTGSFVMINAYPFFAYESEPGVVPLEYALFSSESSVLDPKTGLHYTNLFDAQLDAFFSAMAALGHPTLNITVTETGWPSKGDKNEVGAGLENAATYVANLVKHITSNVGTPLRPGASIDTYIFALFNENRKVGPTSERNYGLFYPNERSVYGLNLRGTLSPSTSTPTQASPPFPRHRGRHHQSANASHMPGNWCVATASATPEALQGALDYACGPGQADCSLIQPGQACFNPNTLVAHASYAFNSYYQLHQRAAGSCVFAGAASVVAQNPSYSGCEYPGSP